MYLDTSCPDARNTSIHSSSEIRPLLSLSAARNAFSSSTTLMKYFSLIKRGKLINENMLIDKTWIFDLP